MKCIEINDFGQWYTFVVEPMSLDAAVHFCEEGVNGVLLFSKAFSSEDWIDASMVFFHELGCDFLWVGIRVGGDGELIDAHGNLQSNITVDGYTVPGDCLALIAYYGLEPWSCQAEHSFICELNNPLE